MGGGGTIGWREGEVDRGDGGLTFSVADFFLIQ